MMKTTEFANKHVLVMGLGSFGGGADSAAFAARQGANVTVTDLADAGKLADTLESLKAYDIRWVLGRHEEADFRGADAVIVNPAVPPENRYVQLARQAGAVITSQVQLFFEQCPATIAAITGSNGKSTTTALTAHLLAAGRQSGGCSYGNVYLSGNIGNRPLLGLLDELNEQDIVVLEISSFQIEQLAQSKLGPRIALITNLTPNHLDRHGTFAEYCRAKKGLFAFQPVDAEQPAVSIFNAMDAVCIQWYEKYQTEPGRKCLTFHPDHVPAELAAVFPLPGRVNLQNLAAALCIAGQFGLKPGDLKEAVSCFEGLENRLKLIAEIGGVRWYDDSKATTPISTMAALNGIDEPKILIAGGYDKGIDFTELGQCIVRRAKAAVLIGKTACKIEQAVRNAGPSDVIVEKAESMVEAVKKCSELAQKGDVVLMSPACASYDMFKNYQERARSFSDAVTGLSQKQL